MTDERLLRLRLTAGIIGPAVFTAAWAVSTARQEGYAVRSEHISGLAAPDARDPAIMTAGFLGLGVATRLFADGLTEILGGPARAGYGPALLRLGGTATVAAAVARRDTMLLTPPEVAQSWRNDAHDAVAACAYFCLLTAPPVLAVSLGEQAQWARLRRAAMAASALTAGGLALFASGAVAGWNGVVQRVAVTVPLAGMAAAAAQLLRRRPPATGQPWVRRRRRRGTSASRHPAWAAQTSLGL